MKGSKFFSFGVSVVGASHKRSQKPNQDSFCFFSGNDFAVATVCDGHGGEKFIRSDIGSRLAAKEVTSLMEEFCQSNPTLPKSNSKLEERLHRLKKNILYYWGEAVQKYNSENPITEAEFAQISNESQRNLVKNKNMLAYGTTLITVAVTKEYTLCLQLGDGDITLLYGEEGAAPLSAMEEDGRLIANETTSLCTDNAINDFRVKIINPPLPELVVISSDGVSNSFNTKEDFLGLATDISVSLSKNGVEGTKSLLQEGLERLTATGSGDDVTIAVLWSDFQ